MLVEPTLLTVEDLPLDILSLITKFLRTGCISRLAQTSKGCRCRILEILENVGGKSRDGCSGPSSSGSLKCCAFHMLIGRQGLKNLKCPSRRLVFSNESLGPYHRSSSSSQSELFLLSANDVGGKNYESEPELLEIQPNTGTFRCYSLYDSFGGSSESNFLDSLPPLFEANGMAREKAQLRAVSKNALMEINIQEDFWKGDYVFSLWDSGDSEYLENLGTGSLRDLGHPLDLDRPHSFKPRKRGSLGQPRGDAGSISSSSGESEYEVSFSFDSGTRANGKLPLTDRKKLSKKLSECLVCRTSSQFLFLAFRCEELIFFVKLSENWVMGAPTTVLAIVSESLESLASLSIRHVAGCLPVDKATVDKSKQTIVAATFHEGNNVLFWSQEYVTTHSLELSGHAEISSVLPVILNGYLWVGYEDGSLSVVSTDDGTVMQTFNLKAAIWKMEYFDDSPFIIVCCGDGSFHVLSQSTGEDRKASTIISSINLFQYEKTGVATTLAVDTLTQYFGLGGTSYFICVAANEKVRILQFQNSAHCPFKNSLAHQETGQFDQALIKRGEVEILSQCFVSALSISGHCLILGGVEGSIQLWSYRGTPTLLRTIYRTKDPRCFNKLGLNTVTNIVDLLPHFFGASLARGKVFGQAFTTYNRLVKGKKVNSKG